MVSFRFVKSFLDLLFGGSLFISYLCGVNHQYTDNYEKGYDNSVNAPWLSECKRTTGVLEQ